MRLEIKDYFIIQYFFTINNPNYLNNIFNLKLVLVLKK